MHQIEILYITLQRHLSKIILGVEVKQGMKQIAPVLASSGTASNRIKNYWVQEGGRAFLPCLSYGNPPPLTRYHCYID